jgi:hypothetical protein
MNHFTLEALPAQHGDSLLLHYGSADAPGLVMIDGGPSGTWEKSLKPRLQVLKTARGDDFKIDLLMVSHIDDDHIVGVVNFTDKWVIAQDDGAEWPFPVLQLWHNSFERISNTDLTKVTASVLASTEGAVELGDVDLDEVQGDEHEARAAIEVLASVAKGAKLRANAKKLQIEKNVGFDGLVRPGVGEVPYPLDQGLTLHVVGPLTAQLDALREEFAKELPPGAPQTLAAYVDESVPNLSSIVALAEFQGKTMLLTGDARGDYVLQGLEAEGLLDANGKRHVDLLKLQHHGSVRNTEDEFYERITADHYVVSADGRFGNPDRETFRLLIDARGKDAEYTIHLTYPVAAIDAARKAEWEQDRLRKEEKKKTRPKTRVPPPWNDAGDNIAALLADRKARGFKFNIFEPPAGKGPRIDLLDPIPF